MVKQCFYKEDTPQNSLKLSPFFSDFLHFSGEKPFSSPVNRRKNFLRKKLSLVGTHELKNLHISAMAYYINTLNGSDVSGLNFLGLGPGSGFNFFHGRAGLGPAL